MSWETGDAMGQRLRIAPGATLTADPSTFPWIDVTHDVAFDAPITVTIGSADEETETNSEMSWTFRDNRGRYDIDNPESDLWGSWDVGTAVEFAINLDDGSGWIVLASMYVTEIGDDYSTGPHRIRRDIQAAGMFQRLGQGKTLSSPITRTARSLGAVRYYRLEEGSDARFAVSDVANQPPLVRGSGTLPTFAARTGVAGSLAVAQFQAGQSLTVNFSTVKFSGTTATWSFLLNVNTLTVGTNIASARVSGSGIAQWVLYQNPGECPRLKALDGFGTAIYNSTAFGAVAGMIGGTGMNRPDSHPWWWISIKITQSGADLVAKLNSTAAWMDDLGNYGQAGYLLANDTVTSQQLGTWNGWTLCPDGGAEDLAIGHMGLYDSAISTPLDGGSGAVAGWPQNAHDRIAGVSNEMGLPNNVSSSPTVNLGPQQPGTTLGLLRDAAKADHGVLDDSRGRVEYTALYDLLNATPVIHLNGANRELFMPFAPVRDDQKRKNSITASRPGGSSATVDDLTDQAKAGLYSDSPSYNLASDNDLVDHAQFGVTVGTTAGKRVPQVTLQLHVARHLAAAWVGMRLGDRFQVDSPPKRPGASFQLQLRGSTQTFTNRRLWEVVCNTVRADPFNVGVVEDPTYGRAEADEGTVTTTGEYTTTATTLTIATAAGHPVPIDSTTNPSDFPLLLDWEGEQISIPGITGTSSPQTATGVTRSVNGVRKIHKTGAVLKLAQPCRPAF